MMRRSLKALGNNKYFKKLTVTPTKQAGVTDALRKAKSYIREGKEQIRQGKEVLRTGRIPGSMRVYSKDMYTKWAKDKIRLGKANKLTGTIIYRKLKMGGLDIGRFSWSGKAWSAYHKGQKLTISKEGINKSPKERGSRDQGWGKFVTKNPRNPIYERANRRSRSCSTSCIETKFSPRVSLLPLLSLLVRPFPLLLKPTKRLLLLKLLLLGRHKPRL